MKRTERLHADRMDTRPARSPSSLRRVGIRFATCQLKDYLIGDFSAADIMLGHACVMSGRLGLITDEMPHLAAYVERLNARPALIEAMAT